MIEDKYIGTLDAQDKRWYDYLIRSKGGEIAALYFLLKGLDCTRIYPDGSRPMQTINYAYRTDIAGFIYINNQLTKRMPECEVDFYDKLVTRHEENLSFEEHNRPVSYTKKSRASGGSSTRTFKSKDLFTGEQTVIKESSVSNGNKKENAASRKAKALKDKSISFAFNNFKINK